MIAKMPIKPAIEAQACNDFFVVISVGAACTSVKWTKTSRNHMFVYIAFKPTNTLSGTTEART